MADERMKALDGHNCGCGTWNEAEGRCDCGSCDQGSAGCGVWITDGLTPCTVSCDSSNGATCRPEEAGCGVWRSYDGVSPCYVECSQSYGANCNPSAAGCGVWTTVNGQGPCLVSCDQSDGASCDPAAAGCGVWTTSNGTSPCYVSCDPFLGATCDPNAIGCGVWISDGQGQCYVSCEPFRGATCDPAAAGCGVWVSSAVDAPCYVSCDQSDGATCDPSAAGCGVWVSSGGVSQCTVSCAQSDGATCGESVCGGTWTTGEWGDYCRVPASTCTVEPDPCGRWEDSDTDAVLSCDTCPVAKGSCLSWAQNGFTSCGPSCDSCQAPSCGQYAPDYQSSVPDRCSVLDCSDCGDAGCGEWHTEYAGPGPDFVCGAYCDNCAAGPCGEEPTVSGTPPYCSVSCDTLLEKVRSTMASDGYANSCDDWSCGSGLKWEGCESGCVCSRPQDEKLCVATGGSSDGCRCACPERTRWIDGIGCSSRDCPLRCPDGTTPEPCALSSCSTADTCEGTCPPGHSHDPSSCRCACMNTCSAGQNQAPDCLCYDKCAEDGSEDGCTSTGGAWDKYKCACDCSGAGSRTFWDAKQKKCVCPSTRECANGGTWDPDRCMCDCSSASPCGTGASMNPEDCSCECSAEKAAVCIATKADDGSWDRVSCSCDCGSRMKWRDGVSGCVCKTEQDMCGDAGGTWAAGGCFCPSGKEWKCLASVSGGNTCASCECVAVEPCDPDGSRERKCTESHGSWIDEDQSNCRCQCDSPYENDPSDTDKCRCEAGIVQDCDEKPAPHHMTEACDCVCDEDRSSACEDSSAAIVGTWRDDTCSCDCGLDGRAAPNADGRCECRETEEKLRCTEDLGRVWDDATCTCKCAQSRKDECDLDDPGSDWQWLDYPDCVCTCPHAYHDPCTIHAENDGLWDTVDSCSCVCKDDGKESCELRSWGRGGTWDHSTCSCVCDTSARTECSLDQELHEWDEETCSCSCRNVTQETIDACESKPDGHHFWDVETCSCKCDNEDPLCGDGSDVEHAWDDETCSCKCVGVTQEERNACAECTDDNPSCGTWDEEKCKCACPSGKKPTDEGTCACDKNDELKTLCETTKSANGTGWDPKTCKCGCGTVTYRDQGTGQNVTKERLWWDLDGCQCPNDPDEEGRMWSEICALDGLSFDQQTCDCGCSPKIEAERFKEDCDKDENGTWIGRSADPGCYCKCKDGYTWTGDIYGAEEHYCRCQTGPGGAGEAKFNEHKDHKDRGWKWNDRDCKWECSPLGIDQKTGQPPRCTMDNGEKGWATDTCGCECIPKYLDCRAEDCLKVASDGCHCDCLAAGDCREGGSCHGDGWPSAADLMGDKVDAKGARTSDCGDCICAEDGSRYCYDGIVDENTDPQVARLARLVKASSLDAEDKSGACVCRCDEVGEACIRAKGKSGCTYNGGCPGKVSNDCQCVCDLAGQPCAAIGIKWGAYNNECDCVCADGRSCRDDDGMWGTVKTVDGECRCVCDDKEGKEDCLARANEARTRDVKGGNKRWRWSDGGCECLCADAGASCTYVTDAGEILQGTILEDTCDCGGCNKTDNDCIAPATLNKAQCRCTCDDWAEYAEPCDPWKRMLPERGCECDCKETPTQEDCDARPMAANAPEGATLVPDYEHCGCMCDTPTCKFATGVTGVTDPSTCECLCPYKTAAEANCNPAYQEFDASICGCKCRTDLGNCTDDFGNEYVREMPSCDCKCLNADKADCKETYGGEWIGYKDGGKGCRCDCAKFRIEDYLRDNGMVDSKYWQVLQTKNGCSVVCTVGNHVGEEGCESAKAVRDDGVHCDCNGCSPDECKPGTPKPDFDGDNCACYCNSTKWAATCGKDETWVEAKCSCEKKKCNADPGTDPHPCKYWDTSGAPDDCKWVTDTAAESEWNAKVSSYKSGLQSTLSAIESAQRSINTKKIEATWCEAMQEWVDEDKFLDKQERYLSALEAAIEARDSLNPCKDTLIDLISRNYPCGSVLPNGCSVSLSSFNSAKKELESAYRLFAIYKGYAVTYGCM